MALASPFQTFSLCPGHENPGILAIDSLGETRNPVSFSEEIPIRLGGPFGLDEYENQLEVWEKFRVNLPAKKILPLLWNMKEWEVAFNFSMTIQEINDSLSVGNPQWTCSHLLTGKFMHYFLNRIGLSATSSILSTNLEPALKVDGLCDYHDISGGNIYTGEGSQVFTGQLSGTRLLPSVNTNHEPFFSQYPYYAFSSEVMDSQGNLSGSVEGSVESTKNFTEYGNSVTEPAECSGRILVYRLFLKNDGTVDVLFNARVYLQDSSAGFVGQLVSETYSSPSVAFEPVTLTFFGEEVPAYVAFLSFPPFQTRTLENFNFSYDVTVEEEWTY
jgi:hypothetical protein